MIESASQTFSGVFDQVEETGGIVAHMVVLIGQVDRAAQQMAELMEDQLQVSQDISRSATEMREQTEVVTLQSEKAADSAQALEQQSGKLLADMKQFKI